MRGHAIVFSVRRWLVGLAVPLSMLAASPAVTQEGPSTAPPVVETAAVKLASVTRQGEFVGTVLAAQQVDLIARVEGFLEKVGFAEGSFVKAGSVAFEIEKDSYQAALDGAEATLKSAEAAEIGAKANLTQAELSLTRQKELLKTNAVAQSAVDQAQATRDSSAASVDQAAAQITQAQAQVKTAQINLSYTDVVSPISGRIGRTKVTAGNLVSPNTGTLATVVQVDPIRVAFSISDREYLEVVKVLKPDNSGLAADAAAYQPSLVLPDGTPYGVAGKIAFLDNQIDPTTGTIAVYTEFPNPQMKLVPGQFVSVTVQAGEAQQLPVVPATAILQDQDGAYVFSLGDGDRAQIRRVTLGPRVDTDWAVTAGLAAGEMIIVSGIQKVQAGMVVKPAPAAGN